MSTINTLQKMELSAYKASLKSIDFLKNLNNDKIKKTIDNFINTTSDVTRYSLGILGVGLLASSMFYLTLPENTQESMDSSSMILITLFGMVSASSISTVLLTGSHAFNKTLEYLGKRAKERNVLEENPGYFICEDKDGTRFEITRENLLLHAVNNTLTDNFSKILLENDVLDINSKLNVKDIASLPYLTTLSSEVRVDNPKTIKKLIQAIQEKALMEQEDNAIAYEIMKSINLNKPKQENKNLHKLK